MERFFRGIPNNAVAVLVVAALLTALAAVQLFDPATGKPRLRIDPSAEQLLPEGDASREFYDRVRRLFGSDETVLIALVADDVFTTPMLGRVRALTERLSSLDGVHHVLSLTNAVNVRGVDDDLEIAPFVDAIPEQPERLDDLRREVLGNPIYSGSLVSSDSRATALLVYLAEMSDDEYIASGLDGRIVAIAEQESGDAEAWVTGGPHLRAETARVLLGELLTIPLAILAVLAVVLLLSFRSISGVLFPLVSIVVAVTWTMGLTAAFGYELNGVTALVPALLTALGLSYAVHVVSEFSEEGDEDGAVASRERVQEALSRVALPVGLTGLTTAAGFASLSLSPLGAVREFGQLSVIGVSCAAIAALTVTPAMLALLPSRPSQASGSGRGAPFRRFVDRVARFDVSHRRTIFLMAALVFMLALAGVAQLRIGTQQVSKFREDAPVRVHFEAVNEHLGGANLFFVVLETQYPEGFKEPANLAHIQSLQQWLEEQPEIGGTTSLVDYIMLLNRGFHGNAPESLAIPDTRRIVSQLLFFGGSDELDSFVDSRFEIASIRVRTKVVDSDSVNELANRIERRLEQLPTHLEATLTGTSIVFTRTLDAIIRGQATSMIAAFGLIYLVLSALFVSPRIGFIALIPNVLPVAFYFGALGWFGVRLDPATSLIAPMVLGIAVDDTIHYFARFIRDVKQTGSERRATVSALRAVGRPVTYTSIALCLGFLTLNASEMRANAELGSMAALALAFAWLTDFTLTPALCVRLRIATLWDYMRLDLGEHPQQTISVFRGMRAAQAKLVALMATVVEVKAGERLFNAGEPGEAMYVVLQGRLRASIGHKDGSSELANHSRGGVLGEVGIFNDARIADVDVIEDARLLRLTGGNIERLRRQRPKIASLLFRNLNEILAHRTAKATAREVVTTGTLAAHDSAGQEALDHKARVLEQAFFRADAELFRGSVGKQPGDPRGSVGKQPGDLRGSVGKQPGDLQDESELAQRLSVLGISADSSAALTIVPMVEVAWADGSMDEEERKAILAGADATGLSRDTASFELLSMWLANPPEPDLAASWREYIQAVCGQLSVEGRFRLRDEIVGQARAVAEAAGGVLGIGSISRAEERVLAQLERAFDARSAL